jgi:hypothetical protein
LVEENMCDCTGIAMFPHVPSMQDQSWQQAGGPHITWWVPQ